MALYNIDSKYSCCGNRDFLKLQRLILQEVRAAVVEATGDFSTTAASEEMNEEEEKSGDIPIEVCI